MADIVQELTIEATPENVFHALTTSDGIAEWWSNLANQETGRSGALDWAHLPNRELPPRTRTGRK